MLHLSTDRLAALGDESPTGAEAEHLASCARCARERDAYRALVSMARAERDSIGLPLTRWDSIASALTADSRSVAPGAASATTLSERAGRRHIARLPMRAAAALLLVAGGVMAGRVSAGARVLPSAGQTGGVADGAARPSQPSVKTSIDQASLRTDSVAFTSVDDARLAQLRSEAIYQEAAAFLAQHDTTGAGDGSPVAYRSRLAALDQVISTTREAMRQAPHDPVINGYYLTTLGQREATLRQMNTVLPRSLRANSY